MTIELKTISKDTFDNSNRKLLSNDKFNREFAKIICNNNTYTIGWASDLLRPVLIEVNDLIFAVGVDQTFAIVNHDKDIILLRLPLLTNLHDIRIINNRIIVLDEMEIYVINTTEWSFIKKDLPDYLVHTSNHNDILAIECLDGSRVEIDLSKIGNSHFNTK